MLTEGAAKEEGVHAAAASSSPIHIGGVLYTPYGDEMDEESHVGGGNELDVILTTCALEHIAIRRKCGGDVHHVSPPTVRGHKSASTDNIGAEDGGDEEETPRPPSALADVADDTEAATGSGEDGGDVVEQKEKEIGRPMSWVELADSGPVEYVDFEGVRYHFGGPSTHHESVTAAPTVCGHKSAATDDAGAEDGGDEEETPRPPSALADVADDTEVATGSGEDGGGVAEETTDEKTEEEEKMKKKEESDSSSSKVKARKKPKKGKPAKRPGRRRGK